MSSIESWMQWATTKMPAHDSCLMYKLVVVGVTILFIFCVLVKMVEFLYIIRRESPRTQYRLFLGLSLAFLCILAYFVADFAGPKMSPEARNHALIATLLIVLMFLWMYNKCVVLDTGSTAVELRAKASKDKTLYDEAASEETYESASIDMNDINPPNYGDLYPPAYSAVVRGQHQDEQV